MRHVCHACGHEGHVDLAASDEADGDERAIEELTRRVRRAGPSELGRILRGVRDQLRFQRKGARRVTAGLQRIIRGVLDWVRTTLDAAPGGTVPDRVRSAQATLATLADAIREVGLGDLMAEVQEIQASLVRTAWETAQASGVIEPSVAPGRDLAAMAALLQTANLRTLARYWDRDVVQSIVDSVTDGLEGAIVGETLDEAVARIERTLNVSTGRAKNMARTQMAQFSSAVTASIAAAIEAEEYYYAGPQDGLTRDFCAPLAGYTITAAQLRKLDNGTGFPVATTRGGPNCRHSLTPIMPEVARAAGIPQATDEQIDAANRGGKR